MVHHTSTRRRSSHHYTATASATFGFRINLARRASRAERSDFLSSSHHHNNYTDTTSHHNNNSSSRRRLSTVTTTTTTTTIEPHYYRPVIVVPSSSPPPQQPIYTSSHAYCIANDATYARLAARLERLRGYKAAVKYHVRENGEGKGLGMVLDSLRESVHRLEVTLEGMKEKICKGACGWDGSDGDGKPFVVGGRWVRFL